MRSRAISSPARYKGLSPGSGIFVRSGSKVLARSLKSFASFSGTLKARSHQITHNTRCDFARIITIYMIVLLTQWILLTYLQPFFPQFAASIGIRDDVTGVIFACYPIGAMIMAPCVGFFIQRFGTKLTVCGGLAVAGIFTMLFGLSKDYLGVANPNQQYLFIVFSFLYGMGSTLADTGMLVAVERQCTMNNLARILALGEIAVGVGCLIGPGVGGFLVSYAGTNCSATVIGFLPDPSLNENASSLSDAHGDTEHAYGCWLSTFVVMAGSAFTSLLLVIVLLPPPRATKRKFSEVKSSLDDTGYDVLSADGDVNNSVEGKDKPKKSSNCCSLLQQYQLMVPVVLYFFTSANISCLTPVLALRLADPDTFNMDSSTIGLVYLISAFTYMIGSLFLGWAVDKIPTEHLKGYMLMLGITAFGPLLAAGGWFLVGPFQLPFLPEGNSDNDPLQPLIPSLTAILSSQALLGLGSAASTIPTIPLMLYWVPEHKEDHRALITASFMSVYTAAAAAGNVLGGILYSALGFRKLAGTMVVADAVIMCFLLVFCVSKLLRSRRSSEAQSSWPGSGSGLGWNDSMDGNGPLLAGMVTSPNPTPASKSLAPATPLTSVVAGTGMSNPHPGAPPPLPPASTPLMTGPGIGKWSPRHGAPPTLPAVPAELTH